MCSVSLNEQQFPLRTLVVNSLLNMGYSTAELEGLIAPSDYHYKPVNQNTRYIAILKPPQKKIQDIPQSLLRLLTSTNHQQLYEHLGTFDTQQQKGRYELTAMSRQTRPRIALVAKDLETHAGITTKLCTLRHPPRYIRH
ncbi:MAG: hypothetical protein Q7R56_02345 [Nanoarchaeota archaeon]|nr:hypothetical protein [Nanoarchaeota archaeon]